jgi:glycosyltransferase involved in cell wall biosynthesis
MTDAVTFTGRMDTAGMAALYRGADLMVNPSLADNMPISILEALASGVPVVSTAVGGVPYMVEHGKTALLVPAQDPAAMADAILTLLNEPAQARQISEAGKEFVQQYAWSEVRDRLLCVYEQVLTRPRTSAVGIK